MFGIVIVMSLFRDRMRLTSVGPRSLHSLQACSVVQLHREVPQVRPKHINPCEIALRVRIK